MVRSVYDLFHANVEATPDAPAARFKRQGTWNELSWAGMSQQVEAVSAALLASGVEAGERVSILSNTRVEWTLCDLGIVGVGGVTVPIYQSNTPAEIEFLLADSGATSVFAEDLSQLEKLRQIRLRLPQVRRVVVFDPGGAGLEAGWEVAWEDFLAEGRSALPQRRGELEARRGALAPGDLVTLIYTSGTTGRPKGVEVTHDNLVFAAWSVREVGLYSPGDVQLLFLPLAHSFAKLLQVGWLGTGSIMAYAESIDKVVENMKEVRPHFMASVPRVFEKVHARVVGTALAQQGLQGRLARWAFAKGSEAARAEVRGESPGGLAWWLARKLVFTKVGHRLSELFGGRVKFFVSGGAPLSQEIAYFFKYAGVMICEGYGLTETSSIATVNRPGQVRIGTIGQPFPGVELEVADDGEILIRSRSIFTGYWKQPEATAEVLSPDGWFATGDIGKIEEGQYVRITDRKKDLIITAGGKNIAPQYLENLIKSRSPLVSQAVVFGDRRPYLVALITLDEAALAEWGRANGIAGDHALLSQRPEVRRLVEEVISGVNRELPRYETIKRFHILDHDFEVGDQLTPTMKVKRRVCTDRYGDLFESLYEEEAPAEASA